MAHQTWFPDAWTFTGSSGSRMGARAARFALDRFLLLPIGAAIALIWANTAPESYFLFAQDLRFPVNNIAMALFFGLLAQEVFEAVMPGGALHTWRRWTTPIVAALGATVVAPAVFLLYAGVKHEAILFPTWPIACAIDVVAAYYVLTAIKVRRGVLAFALLMAIAANAMTLLIVAPRPSLAGVHPAGLLLIAASLGIAALMRTRGVRSFWPYLAVCGSLSWCGFYLSGIHPALALMPIVLFLPHEPRALEDFPDTPDDDPTHHEEHEWNQVVQVILFFFGLMNAGVMLAGYGTGTWALLTAALVGRPIGALAGVAVATAAGLHLPSRVAWRDLAVVALATSSGFTLALFVAVSVIAPGSVLSQLKIGALSIVIGALLAFGAAAALHVGRFAHRHARPA